MAGPSLDTVHHAGKGLSVIVRAASVLAGVLVVAVTSSPGVAAARIGGSHPTAAAVVGQVVAKPGHDKGDRDKGDRDKGDRDKGNRDKGNGDGKPDRRPPSRPVLGTPDTGAGGRVSLPVRAERNSRITVVEGGRLITSATATGGTQTLTWNASTGRHTYTVTAADRRGRRSGPSGFSVTADATPPRLTHVSLEPGTPADTRSHLRFTTAKGSAYQVLRNGAALTQSTAGRSKVDVPLDLANGRSSIQLVVSDDVGNAASETEQVRVDVRRLEVAAKVVTKADVEVQRLRVRATPNAAGGEVRIMGRKPIALRFQDGRATARLHLPEGEYDDVRVTVRDSQGRTGGTVVEVFDVDLTPPVVGVEIDQDAADDGLLRAVARTDAGATVAWRLVTGDDATVAQGEVVAESGTAVIERDVAEGDYRLEVTATDAFDRASNNSANVRVDADPWPRGVWTGIWALLGVVLLIAAFLLRRSWPALKERRVEQRARQAQRRALRAEQPSRVRRATYRTAKQRWRREYDALAGFLANVQAGAAEPSLMVPLDLLPDEFIRFTTPARLHESSADGEPLAGVDGELVVTDRRIAFTGPVTRDWWCGLIGGVEHLDDDQTLLRIQGEEAWSGIVYADTDVTRLYLGLVLAEQDGTKEAYVAAVEQELRAHNSRRPSLRREPVSAGS